MKLVIVTVMLAGAAILAAGCGGSNQQENGMSSMPAEAPPGAATQTAADGTEVTFEGEPQPSRTGENTFAVAVANRGEPVTDADVSVELFMAAMPSMNMAEMRNTIALTHSGGGRYEGAGPVMMAGGWDVIVHVRRGGQEVAAPTFGLTAQ